MKWIRTDDVQDGDIIETPSKIPPHSPFFPNRMFPLIKHYGMIVHIDDQQCIVHNIIGRQPTITPCCEVFTDRKIERVLRTGMCREEILEKFNSCNCKKYSLWNWNCESLMTFIWGFPIGIPQRDAWTGGTTLLLLIIILLLVFRRRSN